MPNGQLHTVVQFIRKIAVPRLTVDLSDRQLLEQFIDRRDQGAFAVLLQRHGPLVLSVCQRLLRNIHDSEDAFQATFLVLIRKAKSIAKHESVGSWLHGVAYRIAARARSEAILRRVRERKVEPAPAPDLLDEVIRRDLRAMLDEEVLLLPSRCRVPFVLCYMEGKTNEEAAHLIGCPKGTVLSRLARARELLRTRLSRRGLTVSAALVTTMLSQKETSAAVSASLVETTMKAAVIVAAGNAPAGIVSAKVIALLEGALWAMWLSKLKTVGIMFLVGCLTCGISVLTYRIRVHAASAVPDHESKPVAASHQKASLPAKSQQEAKRAFEAARGYAWLVEPKEGWGSLSSFGFRDPPPGWPGGAGPFGIVAIQEEDKEGGLLITLAHPVSDRKSGLPDFRPVAFDAGSIRYPLERQQSGSGGNIAMARYSLDPKILPAAKVKYLGVETLTPDGEELIAREAFARAKKEGIEILPPARVGEAYDFGLTAMDGKKISTRDFRGKVVLIDCWANWCSPCVGLLPEFKKLYEKYHRAGLEVIGINFDSDVQKALKKIKELKLSWPQVHVSKDETTRKLWQQSAGIGSLPRLFLIDREGVLRADNPQDLEGAVAKLLSSKPSK
jgi:RNA polymerase sigma factor (sigma-70 family)